jgi:flagellar hook assembly protein FlgD
LSTERLARAVFALLVVASFAAFGITQRLKHTPPAVQSFEMDTAFRPTRAPAAGCRGRVPTAQVNATKRVEYLSFKPASADVATVAIVDSAGAEVATIVRDLRVERYKQVSLCWNGHRGARQTGRLAPAGEYRLRVRLRHESQARYSPESFTLEGAGR